MHADLPSDNTVPEDFDTAEIVVSAFNGKGVGDYLASIPVRTYPSGEPLIEWPSDHHIDFMLLRPKSMTTFMAAMWFIDALAERGRFIPPLLLPFIPGARQDRMNSTGDFLFTAKSVAREINIRNFPRVTVIDPHSNVAAALINNCHVIKPADFLKEYIEDCYDGIISSDAGAEHRAGDVAKTVGVELLHGWKNREVGTGVLTGFGLQHITEEQAGGHFLIVDDICDGGGTFLGLYDKIEERGITADLYTTHGVYSQGVDKLLKRFNRVITTDSYISGEQLSLTTPEPAARRLNQRIIEARGDRWTVIPICKKLIMEGF